MPLLLLLHLDCHCCCCRECCCCCCSVRQNQQHALLWIVLSNSLAESDRCQVLFVARRLQKMLCINLRRLQLTSKSMCLLDNDLQTQRPSVACSVDRLHLLTLVPSELRLVAQIVASDDTASKTLSQHFSFVERPTARRTGSKAQPVATPAKGYAGPRKTGPYSRNSYFWDNITHSYISRPERTYVRTSHWPINSMDGQ